MFPSTYPGRGCFAIFAAFMGIALGLVPVWSAPPVPAANAPKTTVENSYIWTDAKASIQLGAVPPDLKQVVYSVKLITRDGINSPVEGSADVVDGHVEIKPLREGIHIVEFQLQPPVEVRFLAIDPPPSLTSTQRAALLVSLPREGQKLLDGKPFLILAMGDSVTGTGEYPTILAMMLGRATGNTQVAAVKRPHSGMSVDATVREWPEETSGIQPDLGLIEYGLNEQAASYPLEAYLEQYQWITERLRQEFNADTVFLKPTPDIGIPLTAEDKAKPNPNPNYYVLRTIGFAEALRPLADSLKVPLAETFSALWGQGGATLEEAARGMEPLHPLSYSKQLSTMLETGKGDTIHPNALGHLAMARAIFAAIVGEKPEEALTFKATTAWTSSGVISEVHAVNASSVSRQGHFEVYPFLQGDLKAISSMKYDLKPGETTSFEVAWPQVTKPEDLLNFPNDRYLATGHPMIPVVDVTGDSSHVYAVNAPLVIDANFVRSRQIVPVGQPATVKLMDNGKPEDISVPLPRQKAGVIPLVRKVEHDGQTGWAAAELHYTQFGAACAGEATVDGDLSEWKDDPQMILGEPFQARFAGGPLDNRATPQEAYIRWSMRAGQTGFYFAGRVTGEVAQDTFTLFLDPRPPEELGTVGRYYWISGKFKPDGRIELHPGTTSPKSSSLPGFWKKTASTFDFEFFAPYSVMDQTAWPASGDLGLSFWWAHLGANGKKTNLLWGEVGHPWNPRWYGVVRRTDQPPSTLPYRVRVK